MEKIKRVHNDSVKVNETFKKEFLFVITLLLLNLNSKLSYISIIVLFFLGIKDIKNSVKAIIYSFIISQLNPAIFSSSIGSLRTILNLIFILKILLNKRVLNKIKESIISVILLIYLFYITITAIYVSWLPVVSIFKGSYFVLGFLAIYLSTILYKEYNWIDWLGNYFKIFLILNIPFIFLPQGYSINGSALNGIMANPNGLGIVLAMGLSIFIYLDSRRNNNKINIFLSFGMILLTNSRTSILTAIILIVYCIVTKLLIQVRLKKRMYNKKCLVKLSCLLFIAVTLVAFYPKYINNLNNMINEKILKGQESDEILKSRNGQIETFLSDYNKNKLLGVGFGVDGKENIKKNYSLKLSYPIERGNIILAILAETGNIGFSIFLTLLIVLIYYSFKNNSLEKFLYINLLFISSLMISIGEMTFFSGNGLGVIQWLFLSIYANQILEKEF